MSDKKWVIASDLMSVAFSLPCQGCYRYERGIRLNIGCEKPDERHGHIELSDDEGIYAFITFPCYSQAGVKAAVELLKQTVSDEERKGVLNDEECKAVLDMEEVKKLPEEMAEEEKLFIASLPEEETKKKRAVFWGWWGW